MRKTTAPGNDGGNYTEGNPGLGVPATVVAGEAANFWQNEIVNTMDVAGIPESVAETDLRDAILALIATGGGATQQIKQTIINNQAAPLALTGLVFDKTKTKTAFMEFNIERSSATPTRLNESGWLVAEYVVADDDWKVILSSMGDDAEVSFTINAAGQVLYTSSDIVGASYAGNFRTSVRKLLL